MKLIRKIQLSLGDKFDKLTVWQHNRKDRIKKLNGFNSWIENAAPNTQFKTYYSDEQRNVQNLESDYKKSSVIVTCYFTKKVDPQHGIIRRDADINYIAPWYNSIVKNNLDGIILHDGLDEAFIKQYENDNVKFLFCGYGNYSIFEERWFAYHQFLANNPQIDFCFFTDSNDVFITSDPFAKFQEENKLYIGRDNANKIRHSKWLEIERVGFEKDSDYKFPKSYLFQPVYNAGVVGGSRKLMLALTAEMINLVMLTKTSTHKDMTLINLVIHLHFPVNLFYSAAEKTIVNPKDDLLSCNSHIFSGFPLNSAFTLLEKDSDAIFIHK